MAKSRNRKDHKKKVAARNNRIEEQKKKYDRLKREFINDLIKKEQDAGLFKDNPPIGDAITEGPVI